MPYERAVRYALGGADSLGKVRNEREGWPRFVERLRTPNLDADITLEEYLSLPKSQQDARKMRPGFVVGGHFKNGHRALQSLQSREMLTIDVDSASPEDVAHIFGPDSPLSALTYFAHTTRKHTPEKPRWRLYAPLGRSVDADEYDAVARIFASGLCATPDRAMAAVDDVSFRPAQIMYLPSVSRDQVFDTREGDGAPIDPDAVLDGFDGDWRDHTQRPRRVGADAKIPAIPGRRAEDPHEKPGVIGAFCRAYSIEEAIERFIPDVYAPGGVQDNRYTYLPGSTSNGVLIYDGDFLYSHHSSDPVGDRLVNAFDLVRVHMFGHLDEDKRPDTKPNNLPSFREMMALANKDPGVLREQFAEMKSAFEDVLDDDNDDVLADLEDIDDAPDPIAWMAGLDVTDKGVVRPTDHNLALIFENDPRIAGAFALDEMDGHKYVRRPLPLGGLSTPDAPLGADGRRRLRDVDATRISDMLSAPREKGGYGMQVGKNRIDCRIDATAEANRVHAVRDKLDEYARAWGRGRRNSDPVDVILDVLRLEDTPYHREAWSVFLIATAGRQYEPGLKFDNVPILQGAQGLGKSTFVRRLAMGHFKELASEFADRKKMVESMGGAMICEVGELAGMTRSEIEDVKQFFSAAAFDVRHAYDRNITEIRFRCGFIGTTNRSEFLRDPTGDRRFWPMICPGEVPFDLERLEASLPDIWGWATTEYKAMRAAEPVGDLPLVLGPEARQSATEHQAAAHMETQEDYDRQLIEAHLDAPVTAEVANGDEPDPFDEGDAPRPFTRVLATVQMIGEATGLDPKRDAARIARALAALGWSKHGQMRGPWGRGTVYLRPGHGFCPNVQGRLIHRETRRGVEYTSRGYADRNQPREV